jgi:hypothetical protein
LLVALGDAIEFERGSLSSCRHRRGRALLAEHRDDHGPFTGPHVAFDVKDLLPGAKHGPAVAHRHRQARTKQRRLQVGMAVAVVPGLLVSVIPAWWNKPPQKRRQVLLRFSKPGTVFMYSNGVVRCGSTSMKATETTVASGNF